MQFLPICYRIHRSSYLKYGGPDPAGSRAPKNGGSADPADPVVPTPLISNDAVLRGGSLAMNTIHNIDLEKIKFRNLCDNQHFDDDFLENVTR